MISNDNFYKENIGFLHANMYDIINNSIINRYWQSVINLNIKSLIKERIIELVSGMVKDFRKEDFRFDVDMQLNEVDYKYSLTINIIPTHPYTEMILKTKNFHILSRKLKIKEILSDG